MSHKLKKSLTLATLDSQKAGHFLFICSFFSYMFVYLARYNLTAAFPSITDAQTGILSADKAGLIGTCLMVAYGAGQFINGFIAERFPPFGLIGFSILLSASANISMYLVVTYSTITLPVMCALWALNGYSQSFIWPTFIRIIATVLPPNQRDKAAANMLMSTAFGFIVAYTISSLVLGLTGKWEPLFLTSALITGGVGIIWLLCTAPIRKKVYKYVETSAENTKPDAAEKVEKSHNYSLIQLLVISGVFGILILNVLFPLIKSGIQDWVPTMVKENFNMSPAFAVAISTIIPVISIPGAMFSRIIMQKFLHDEMRTCTFLFAASAVLLILVGFFALDSLWPMLILFSIITMLMLGVNTMTVGLIPIRFAKYGKTATITGIINSVLAASGGISTYLTGLFQMNFGWRNTIFIFAGLAVIGCIVSICFTKRWMRFKQM